MKRRIIFSNYDDPKNPFYGGGGARAIHEVAKRLAVRHDVKIITADSKVTLRGPVNSAEEKAKINDLARAAAGQVPVDNQLEVKTSN